MVSIIEGRLAIAVVDVNIPLGDIMRPHVANTKIPDKGEAIPRGPE